MTKQAAGSNRLFVDTYDVSGNVSALSAVTGTRAMLDVTDITQTAMDRRGGLVDGTMSVAGWWDGTPSQTPPAVHDVFRNLRQGAVCQFHVGTTAGVPAALLVANQTTYSPARAPDGALAWTIEMQAAAGAGLEWGHALTNAAQTFAATGYGSDCDDLAGAPVSTAFGAILYVALLSIASGNITISAVHGAAAAPTTAVTGCTTGLLTTPGAYRLPSTSPTFTLLRYTRIYCVGTFANAVVAAALVRPIATQA